MLKILRIIHSLFIWLNIFLIIIILGHFIIGPISRFIKDKKGIYHWGTRVWSKAILFLTHAKIKVTGLENLNKDQNYIFAPNHASTVDIFALTSTIPQRFLFVMREDLFKIPLGGKYCRNAGYLPLNIKNPQKCYLDIKNIVHSLKEGESIMYFPEGGRKKELQEFKSGIAKIALESQTPVVPIAISGSAKIFPRRSFVFYPGTIKVFIGKPMRFDNNIPYQEVTNKIREAIAEGLEEREDA